jgi:hypothetical protein
MTVNGFVWDSVVMRFVTAFGCLLVTLAPCAYGHSGHGTSDGASVWHYVTSPSHFGVCVALLLTTVAAGMSARTCRRKRVSVLCEVLSTK